MKILVVTDLYPPHYVGGYEIGCRDVVEKLRDRGHAVRVLTSSFRQPKIETSAVEPEIERVLQFNSRLTDPPHDKRAECAKLLQTVKEFSPDLVYFWNQAGLTLWLPLAVYWHGCRTAFFLSDTNFVSWRIGAWLAGAAQKYAFIRILFGNSFLVRGWPVIQDHSCHFASEFLRQIAVNNGIAIAPRDAVVAHWGIEPAEFKVTPRQRWPVKRLLYVGQMIPEKGVHTAIAALARLAGEFPELTLSLAGGSLQPDYEEKMRALAGQSGLADRVHFLGKVPRAELSRVYAEHDVLVFPSEWPEAFAITPLEAIASGLAIVGTTTGGSGELLRNRETAMTFQAGDAADCARAIRELSTDRELFEKICRQAQQAVRARHTLDAMVDKIESSLSSETAG